MFKAKGRLRHRFWGEYSACIILIFDNEEEARKALPALNVEMKENIKGACGETLVSKGWMQGIEYPDTLQVEAAGTDLTDIENKLVEFGADKNKMTSMKYSVDWGEDFEVTIPLVHQDHPNQEVMKL